tara:strand:+ start:4793 stop:4978 length:186 start_codon:yes stop_codon:yes gene_type:complete
MLRVLYGFGTVIGELMTKKIDVADITIDPLDAQGEGRGGYLPAQEYHFDMDDTLDFEGEIY